MDSRSIIPAKGIVLIEPFLRSENTTTASGLIIRKAKEQGYPIHGKVYAIGDDIKDIKVGECVIFKEPNPNGFKHEGIGLIPVTREQVIAKVDEDVANKITSTDRPEVGR